MRMKLTLSLFLLWPHRHLCGGVNSNQVAIFVARDGCKVSLN